MRRTEQKVWNPAARNPSGKGLYGDSGGVPNLDELANQNQMVIAIAGRARCVSGL